MSQMQKGAKPVGAQGQAYDLSTLSVLIVEDNDYTQDLLRRMVRGLGVTQIELCSDGEEALKKLGSGSYDLVLLDWDIPNMNGCDVARSARKTLDPEHSKFAIIMVTADGGKQRVLAARDAGVDGYLVKPVSARSLYDRIVALAERPA